MSFRGINHVYTGLGWAVLEPNVRGSATYGDSLLRHLEFPYLSLQKPYELDQLQAALDKVAGQKQARV